MNLPVSPSAFVSTPINTDLDLTLHPSFKLIEHRPIEALSMDVLVCQHEQTGAMHYHLHTQAMKMRLWSAFAPSR